MIRLSTVSISRHRPHPQSRGRVSSTIAVASADGTSMDIVTENAVVVGSPVWMPPGR